MKCIWITDEDKVKGFKCEFSPVDMLIVVSGLKYITADIERHPKDRERAQYIYNKIMLSRYEDVAEQTEPQTMYYPQVDGITPSVIEPKFDKGINVRSKYKQGTWLYGDGVYCSCCGYKLETTALLAKCPKCGADMSETDCAWK